VTKKALHYQPFLGWMKRQMGQRKTLLACVKADLEPKGGFSRFGRLWDKN
jgi:hypothetical protein